MLTLFRYVSTLVPLKACKSAGLVGKSAQHDTQAPSGIHERRAREVYVYPSNSVTKPRFALYPAKPPVVQAIDSSAYNTS